MNRVFLGIIVVLGTGAGMSLCAARAQAQDKPPVVVLDTSMGTITIELNKEKAPITVENFLKYVDSGFYDNLIFHRVISSFMIQGGGFDEKLKEKAEGQRGTIKNESGNGLSNLKGTIAMARTEEPDSAQNQFFINVVDNEKLDNYIPPGQVRGGYAVFGKVIDGMDVVEKIRKVRTGTRVAANDRPMGDVPVESVIIKSVKRKAKD